MSRLLFLYILLSVFGYSQEKHLLTLENKPLKEAIPHLLDLYQYTYLFSPDIEDSIYLTFTAQNKPLVSTLSTLLHPHHIQFKIHEDKKLVHIHPKPITLQGILRNSKNEALSDVVIIYEDETILSDKNGRFSFHQLTDKTITLLFRRLGLKSKKIRFTRTDYKTPLHIVLEEDIYRSEDVFSLPSLNYNPMQNEVSIVKKMVSNSYTIGMEDIFESIHLLPGISGAFMGNNNVNDRGFSSNKSIVFFDGIPIYHPGHFKGFVSIFNPETIDKIFYHRGNYPSKFGGRISNVVDIKTKQPNFSELKGTAGISSLNVFASLSIPITKTISLFNAVRKDVSKLYKSRLFQQIETHIEPPNTTQVNQNAKPVSQITYHDINSKITFSPSPNILFQASYLNSLDKSNKVENKHIVVNDSLDGIPYTVLLSPPKTEAYWKNIGYSFSSLLNFNSLSILAEYSNSDYRTFSEYISSGSNDFIEYLIHSKTKTYLNEKRFYLETEFNIGKFNILNGYIYRELNTENDIFSFDYPTKEISRYTDTSLFTDITYTPSPYFTFNLGGRYTRNTTLNILEPRLKIMWKPSETIHFNLSYGKFHQSVHQISIHEAGYANNALWFVANNTNIPVSKSEKTTLSFFKAFTSSKLHLDLYYYKNKNVINQHKFIRSTYPSMIVSSTTVRGADLFYEFSLFGLKNWVGFSDYTLDAPIQYKSTFIPYKDKRRSLKHAVFYSMNQWDISLTSTFETGQPYQTSLINVDELESFDLTIKQHPNIRKHDVKIGRKLNVFGLNSKASITFMNISNNTSRISSNLFLIPSKDEDYYDVVPLHTSLIGFSIHISYEIHF